MLWITKYRHNKITEAYQRQIDDLKEALYRKDKLIEIVDKLADKSKFFADASMSYVDGSDVMSYLDDSVPRYVDDYFGGKVIKQEATPVTILDEKGKATYGMTAKAPDKGKQYLLVEAKST